MTTAIVIPDQTFPVHVPLYDIPNKANSRVFAILGNTLAESLSNHAGLGDGIAVGQINVEEYGIRQAGNADYIKFPDVGVLSPEGVVMMVAFRSSPVKITTGLMNLWGDSRNSDTYRRRIYTIADPSGNRVDGQPLSSGPIADRLIELDMPYLVSMSRYGLNAASHFRFHDATGAVIREALIPTQTTAALYALNTVLEVGNGSQVAGGASLIQGAALWSGRMDMQSLTEAAAYLAGATGVFE